jgi:hypothetical protein
MEIICRLALSPARRVQHRRNRHVPLRLSQMPGENQPLSQSQATSTTPATTIRTDATIPTVDERLPGAGRFRVVPPARFGALLEASRGSPHSGQSKVCPALPSGTRTTDAQTGQVRAGTGQLHGGKGRRRAVTLSSSADRHADAETDPANTPGKYHRPVSSPDGHVPKQQPLPLRVTTARSEGV